MRLERCAESGECKRWWTEMFGGVEMKVFLLSLSDRSLHNTVLV